MFDYLRSVIVLDEMVTLLNKKKMNARLLGKLGIGARIRHSCRSLSN